MFWGVLLFSFISSASADNSAIENCMVCLYKNSGYGFQYIESAAWVVEEPKGQFICHYWRLTHQRSAITWNGVIPENTVGLIHTHPRDKDHRPSGQDQDVAQHLKIPNYVVSEKGVWYADPQNNKVEIKQLYEAGQLDKMLKQMDKKSCPNLYKHSPFLTTLN